MPKFAANLTLMYTEHPFLDRFSAAHRDGFQGVEFLFPYDFSANEIRQQLDSNGLVPVLFNCPPGDWSIGERGIAALPGRTEEFKRNVEQALGYAEKIGNKNLHVMAGVIPPGQDRARCCETYLHNLSYAADQAMSLGITIMIEPINSRDMPGYFLNRQDDALLICKEVAAPNIRLQMDLYHCQISEGDLAMKIKRDLSSIGHIQIAGVPERHEPDIGEINYPYLFGLLDDIGYNGWIGCEYRPKGKTTEGLNWFKAYRK